jgi:hypothetical protein
VAACSCVMAWRRRTSAMAHYQQFRAERLVAAGAVEVTSVKNVSTITWDSMLDEMIAGISGNADKSFVLCAHGNKDGMTMPLVTGSAFVGHTFTAAVTGYLRH